MSYYPKTGSHIIDKFKLVLHLTNYTIKTKLEHATGADTSNLAAKKILLLWILKLTN